MGLTLDVRAGTGLGGVAAGAIDGSLEITSAPGSGATVRGIVPATPIGADE